MTMEILFKVCAFALIALVLAVFLQQYSPQTSVLIAVGACVGILLFLLPQFSAVLNFCRGLAASAGLENEMLLPVFKVMGIALCTRVTAEVCRDNSQRALAVKVELCGALCGLVCAMPLLQTALHLIGVVA